MTAVFDTPVAAVGGKHTLRIGLIRSAAGNAIGDVTGVFTGFFICGLPLDKKRLADVRKVQIAVEFGCVPDFFGFRSGRDQVGHNGQNRDPVGHENITSGVGTGETN